MAKSKYKLTLVRSPKNREFFWRIEHKNGKEICRSSETYKRPLACVTALQRMIDAFGIDDYDDETADIGI